MSINAYRPPDYTLPIERSPIEDPIGIGGEFGAGPYGGSPYGGGFPSFDGVGSSLPSPYGGRFGGPASYGAGASAGGVLQPFINFMSGLAGRIGSFFGGGFTGGN